ncbi:MAG: AAA family ATPase, partial [Acidimicrobiales bacterium]
MISDWPLVGRAEQLRQMRTLIGQPGQPGRPGQPGQLGQLGNSLLLAGPAGVGKTRLAQEFLAMARQAGWATERVRATRAASELPLGAFAPLLPESDEPGGPRLFELLRRSAQALAARAAGRPLALMVDDAQLLDNASATLTHQLVTSGTVAVVATLRSGEPAPDPVMALWKDGLAVRVDLPPLDRTEIEALLTAALGGPADRVSVHTLADRSKGNPLFLRELVLCALDAGVLRQDGGIWRLTGPIRASSRLVELVEARLRDLSPVEREALEVVAYGESLGVQLLERLTDRALLESLERRDLIAVGHAGRRLEVRLPHPMYSEVLRQRIGALRAVALRRTLAQAIEQTGARRRGDILRVATWHLEGGSPLQPDLMLRAAKQARDLCDFGLARRLAGAAVEAGGGFEPALLGAELLHGTGHGEEAERALAALAEEAGDDTQRGRVAVVRCDNLWFGMERLDEAIAVAESAEATIADQQWRDEVAARRISLMRAAGDLSGGLRRADELLERTRGRALVWTCVVATVVHTVAGHIGRAIEITERGHAEHLAFKGPALAWDISVHTWGRCHALAWSGRLAEAESLALREYDVVLANGAAKTHAYLSWELARITRLQGRVKSAERWARESAAIIREIGWPNYLLPAILAEVAHALALTGRAAEAASVLAEVVPVDCYRSPPFWATVTEARAWVEVAAGNLAGGRAVLEATAARAAGRGERVVEASALHDLVRLGSTLVAERLRALAGVTDSPLVALQADHAAAWA